MTRLFDIAFCRQAWLPKLVVILGISLAIWTVLLFPLDVANRASCQVSAGCRYSGTHLSLHCSGLTLHMIIDPGATINSLHTDGFELVRGDR